MPACEWVAAELATYLGCEVGLVGSRYLLRREALNSGVVEITRTYCNNDNIWPEGSKLRWP